MGFRALALAALFLGASSTDLAAQQRFVPGDTVQVRPARQYEAGGVHRWLLGDGYRDLWSLEIPVEVLDLSSYAGGLEPLALGGGQQTQSIRLRGADGLVYNFRSVDKNARRGLDPQLQASLAADVMQDQISSLMPLSAMVVAELLDAAGLFHPRPHLVVMPDDPALGEYQDAFAGVLGWIELRPDEGEDDTPGFAGSERVVGTDRLYERLEEEPDNLVDQRAFLRARLIDFLVGDWDRHPDQWRWAGFPDTIGARDVTLFQPVPRDRDWALARVDGVVQTVASIPYPQYVGFSYDFPSPVDASWNGRGLDRRLMSELDSADFAQVSREVVSAITNDVIERAVRKLPPAYYELEGAILERNLKHRRDGLLDFSERYYDLLARWVDIEATDEDELLLIERAEDGGTSVTLFDLRGGVPRSEPYYQRTFRSSHTEEIRLYANGGDDRIEVTGSADAPIRLRVIGGGGDDEIADATDGSHLWVHDHRGDNIVTLGPKATWDESEWTPPNDEEAELYGARPRDWGSRLLPLPILGATPDDGVIVGARVAHHNYDFRHYPWESRFDVAASIGTETWRPNVSASYLSRTRGRVFRGEVRLDWRGARADRFYGFGNDIPAPGDDDAYRARRSELALTGSVHVDLSLNTSAEVGGGYRRFDAADNVGTVIDQVDPYGYGVFEQYEVFARVALDRRDNEWRPRSGYRLSARISGSPAWLDVRGAYGWVEADLSAYLSSESLPTSPTLAGRSFLRHSLATPPYFAAASIGGGETLRGFRNQRYLGDTALATSLELRGDFGQFSFPFPGELGFLALLDGGRVWVDRASPGRWHSAAGGGLWLSLIDRYAVSLTAAKGEVWGFYFNLGMPF